MSGFFWGVLVGYLIWAVKDTVREWRDAKARVNEVRREFGVAEETQWWKL